MKILTAAYILQLCILAVFGDNNDAFCQAQDPARDVAFVRIGRYRGFTDKGSEYQKTYLMSKYLRTNWFTAKSICKSFDLELASFETLKEVEYFIDMAKNHPFVISYGGYHMHVDGMTVTPNTTIEWYWTNSGTKVSFSLPWQVGDPNFLNSAEYCLALSAHEPSTLGFADFFVPVRSI